MKLKIVQKPNRLKYNGHLIGAFFIVCAIVVLTFFLRLPLWVKLLFDVLLVFSVYRLFFGKLHLYDGQVVLFWGLPSSGKSMFLNKVAYDNRKQGWHIAGNDEFADASSLCEYRFEKKHFGRFAPLEKTSLMIDEASLEGWDNRDWTSNFDEFSLMFWKKIRHFHCCAVLGNQGFGELDCKIRDSLTSTVYFVENKGWYSRAVRMDKDVVFDENGLPQEGYKQPSFFDRLFDPSSVLYVRHKKWGRFYKTYNPPDLPSIADVDSYTYVPSKNPNRVGQWYKVGNDSNPPLNDSSVSAKGNE